MDDLLPWKHLLKPLVRKYAKPGNGRRPTLPEVMLRIYFMQHMYRNMIPVIRFIHIAVVALVAMALRAQADSPFDAEDAVRGGVILKAGAIDSSTVEVGAIAVAQEAETDTKTFLVAAAKDNGRLDSGEHTETESPDSLSGLRNEAQVMADLAGRLEMLSAKTTNNGDGERIAAKLYRGFVGGILLSVVGYLAYSIPCGDNALLCWKGGEEAFLIGYILGTSFGVSTKEPSDQFIAKIGPSLLGSLLGAGAGIGLTHVTDQVSFFLVLPPIMATLASEWSRKPSESHRFSIDLTPGPHGRLSAVAKFRFR